MKQNRKGFTILELLVVVAIIAILAVIAIPNFIGRIDEATESRELAEINAVGKAIATYYADNGVYPTLQGADGTLLQAQPIEGSPHNIKFDVLVPNYLATLPHFSYWWVDYRGEIYHTQKTLGSVSGGVFNPTVGYSYTLYKTNGTTQSVTTQYTLQAGEYIVGKDDQGNELPKISSAFKNAKVHPESGEVAVVSFTKATFTNASATGRTGPTQAQVDTAYASTALAGKVTVSGNGIQLWTVPETGTYTIEAYGAQGGTVTGFAGGKGAIIKGDFVLSAGTQLKILVGQQGIGGANTQAVHWSGGGGGGTFVTNSSNIPYVVAGGGGGAYNFSGNSRAGFDASMTTSGTAGQGGFAGGSGGGAGTGATTTGNGTGAGGSGLTGVGGFSSQSFTSGGLGGLMDTFWGNPALHGGFGGGGGASLASGGGGGYSGGGGGTWSTQGAGGGGGSYNNGANKSNSLSNTGMGKVVITYVGP